MNPMPLTEECNSCARRAGWIRPCGQTGVSVGLGGQQREYDESLLRDFKDVFRAFKPATYSQGVHGENAGRPIPGGLQTGGGGGGGDSSGFVGRQRRSGAAGRCGGSTGLVISVRVLAHRSVSGVCDAPCGMKQSTLRPARGSEVGLLLVPESPYRSVTRSPASTM
jgi:hypothetical protein